MNILLIFPGFIIAFIIVLYYKYRIKRLIEVKLMCKESNKNNVHFYVARDKDGKLYLYIGKPFRGLTMFNVAIAEYCILLKDQRMFKYFGLNKNDYDNLKWEDDPVEVFINMEE